MPRKMLLNDEGSSALHYFDLDAPQRGWTFRGAGRDLQLIGRHRVLRSRAEGYVELDLANGGAVVREVAISDLPGGIESARRLPDGNTIVLGNHAGGIFVWEVDATNAVVRRLPLAGIEKGRLLRLTDQGSFLFCSETNGKRVVHEADWASGAGTLFEVPADVPADSMLKAVRVAPDVVTVSTGYAASLIRVDTRQKKVLQTIGGKGQAEPGGLPRSIRPFFFSGYQMFENGDLLISNWQGHGPGHHELGYQLLRYDRDGKLVWVFDQTEYPALESLNNVIALDDLDTEKLHDEPLGVLKALG
jgi:hypothetical protein